MGEDGRGRERTGEDGREKERRGRMKGRRGGPSAAEFEEKLRGMTEDESIKVTKKQQEAQSKLHATLHQKRKTKQNEK